jgi:hypothetical protein
MEKRGLVIVVVIFTLIFVGCIEIEKTTNQTPKSVVTINKTPSDEIPSRNLTYTEPESTPTTPATPITPITPPPLRATPIPPGLIVIKFMEYYNERDAEKIYTLLSERVKDNHSLDDVEGELDFAEKHNITITPTEDLLDKLWHIEASKTIYFKVNLSIKSKEGVRNTTIDFPLIYIPYTEKKGKYTIVGETGYIDGWVFDEIKKKMLK